MNRNKILFQSLVVLMSVALLGIIAVQCYWIKSSSDQNQEQFEYHVRQAITNAAKRLEQNEINTFLRQYNQLKDSVEGRPIYEKDLLNFKAIQTDVANRKTILYSNTLTSHDYNIDMSFFDPTIDSVPVRSYTSKSRTEIYRNDRLKDNTSVINQTSPSQIIEQEGELDILKRAQFEISIKNIVSLLPIQKRISTTELKLLLTTQFRNYGIETPFEYAIYNNGLATQIKSNKFRFDIENTISIPVFEHYQDAKNNVELLVSFPEKERYLLANIVVITLLSVIFTLVIIVAYVSALNQYIKQRKISEIKTDFINNMTHEFKTPIATINLVLDAFKNQTVRQDNEKTDKYLQMIRDENKRMHAQVENVLRISKLEKHEIEIEKQALDVVKYLEKAIDHVHMIIENRNGILNKHFNATRSIALINEMHFTNVLVNLLDNAIKYSPEELVIDVYTENVKDFILIKIKDKGLGITKVAQKQIFEKFYREHTGDLHNVKGHGLGLAYVKEIIEDHSGQIFVESEKEKGSVFTIKLPLIN